MKQAMIQNVAVGEGCRGVAHKWDETVGRSKFCWRKRREKRGCAHGGSWRERDASMREKTLPRLGMGEDATGGGRVCGAIACSTDVEVKLTPAGLYLTACIYCTASTSQNTARMEVRERERVEAALLHCRATWYHIANDCRVQTFIEKRTWFNMVA